MEAPLKPLALLPTLADLVERPSLAASLPLEAAESLFVQANAQLAAAQGARDALLLRLAVGNPAPTVNEQKIRTLDADQIAAALGQSRRWVFRNVAKLPFIRRVSRKALVASESDLIKWRAAQRI